MNIHPKNDPLTHCPMCDYRYGATDESCQDCGFAPVDDRDDAQLESIAKAEWAEIQKKGLDDE